MTGQLTRFNLSSASAAPGRLLVRSSTRGFAAGLGASRFGEFGYLTSFGALHPYDTRPQFPKELKEQTRLPIHPVKEGRATLTINEAATALNVSADTLRLWEERYGFPSPARTPDGRDEYDRDQMIGLLTALQNSRSVAHAVAEARATPSRPPQHLL